MVVLPRRGQGADGPDVSVGLAILQASVGIDENSNRKTQPAKEGMEMDLIGKATRNEFREALVGFILRDIEMFFDGAGLACNEGYNPPLSGARRSLVERYYANIDFSSPSSIKRLLVAYGEIILGLNRSSRSNTTKDNLLRLMRRDGYEFDGETFVALPRKQQPVIEAIRSLASSFDLPGLHLEIDRIARAAEEDPSLAVGTAKEMVETICKTILDDKGLPSHGEDLPKLVRAVARELALLPENIPDHAKGVRSDP